MDGIGYNLRRCPPKDELNTKNETKWPLFDCHFPFPPRNLGYIHRGEKNIKPVYYWSGKLALKEKSKKIGELKLAKKKRQNRNKQKVGKKIGEQKFDFFEILILISAWNTRQTQKLTVFEKKKKMAKNWLAKNS